MTTILQSKKRNRMPGDTTRVLIRNAKSDRGVLYLPGQEYQPLSAGYNNVINRHYQTVIMLPQHETATFTGE